MKSAPVPRSSRRAAAAQQQHAVPEIDAGSLVPESLVQFVDVQVSKKKLEYERLRVDWLRTLDGKRETHELAHHYHIFRDLFSSPSQIPIPDPVPKVTMPHYKHTRTGS